MLGSRWLTSPIGLAQIGEPPYVTQSHGKADAAQEVLKFVVPLGPLILHVHKWVHPRGLCHAERSPWVWLRGVAVGWAPCRH